jgi:hypothetical protein
MYSTTDHLLDLLNRSAADLIEQRNDAATFTRLQLEARAALAIHLGRSSIPTQE